MIRKIIFLTLAVGWWVLGAEAQITNKKYEVRRQQIMAKMHKLSVAFDRLGDYDSIGKMRNNGQMQALNRQLSELNNSYLKAHPGDETAARILLGHDNDSVFYDGYQLLSDEVKQGSLRDSLTTRYNQVVTMRRIMDNERRLTERTMAPNFTLTDINGREVSLSSFRGKQAVVLDFWGTWCYWCMKGMPEMRKYYNKYCGKVEFIGIDCDDKEDAWRKTVEKERMIWTQLRNEKGDNDVAVKLGVSTYPTKIIIDRDGRIVKVFKGEVPEFYQTLDSLFAPRLPQTYDQEALMEYVLFHFPQDSTDSESNYFSTILRLVDKHVPDALWGERLKSHFAADMMGMVSSEDPRPYLNQYLAASHVDSLQQKVKEAYNRSVALNGRTYPGRLAPDFSFTDTKGKRMSLKSLRGKTLLIDIWGTWCVPCIEEMPFLDKLQQRYAGRNDVHIMSVACDKKREKWDAFLQKHPTSWHQYLITPEGDKVLNDIYHVMGIPRFIIIGKDGRIVNPDAIRPSDNDFNAYFDQIVNN